MNTETDLRLIEALKEDGRATVRELAKKLNLPVTTVHNRLNNLKKNKVIKKFTVIPDFEKLGKGVLAFVMTSVNYDKLENKEGLQGLKRQLKRFPEIEKVYVVTGEIDLMLLVRVNTIKDLDELLIEKLRNIKGIQRTVTQIVLEEAE
ncbi:Lrp/AsnC family transcriptional regulator [Candidatus Woesearchaeota archaeon]|nr:Lrp/AsnC family transcriptional regulator [Candidatus Woesearchaeota archaeon]